MTVMVKNKKLYLEYESKELYVKQVNARDLWLKILDSQMKLELHICYTKIMLIKKSRATLEL